MRAHARVCMCFVLQVLGQVLHGAGAHVCRAAGAGAAADAGAGAGSGAAGAGAGAGTGPSRSSRFTHPQNFVFANPGDLGASK